MSHLMDPDGTDRVVQQRIKEWHREREGERNAHLVDDPEPDMAHRVLAAVARGLGSQVRRLIAAAAAAAKLLEGRQAR